MTRTHTMLPPTYGAPTNQFIYFVYSAGRIKIGFTRGTDVRHKQLTSTGPFPPVILLLVYGTVQDEQALHAQFDDERLHGEWFVLSGKMREWLRRRLCDIGRVSFDQAEADFRDYCQSFLNEYQPPSRRKPRPHCDHGMPVGTICAPCERARDLKILNDLNAKRCTCHRCIREHDLLGPGGFPLSGTQMIVCRTCGNKRCPKASDHNLDCTGSNEPGQHGSVYA